MTTFSRRLLFQIGIALGAACGLRSIYSAAAADGDSLAELIRKNPSRGDIITKSPDEWRKELTPEQFFVLRESGTDRPFVGPLFDLKKSGSFLCAACKLHLFKSDDKFDSGTGWPSFTKPSSDDVVTYVADTSLFMQRVEVKCARCDGHLGHVFSDGPAPTRLRYCINTAALTFTDH